MTHGAIELYPVDLAVAAAFVVLAGGVSVLLRLRLEGRLAVAAVRTLVQLLAVGFVLKWVFEVASPLALVPIIGVMILVAAHAAVRRPSRSFRGMGLVALFSLVVTSLGTTFIVTGVIIGVSPPYRAQYLIPLMGMVLGNSLTAISLSLDHLLESVHGKRAEIEMELSLGATRWEAAQGAVGEAVYRGMIPMLNSMMVVGLVALPGMMTGQILEGADPVRAVKYQIVVMFMLCGATALAGIIATMLAYRRLFNAKHQLDIEKVI
jgi:putative ABC transport system permease protein